MPHSLIHIGLLSPQALIDGAGVWALVVVCSAVFAESGLLIGFFLPGDTLLFFTGVLTLTGHVEQPLWLVILAVAASAVLGDQVGYFIGKRSGPAVFERRESGLFSRESIARTRRFFDRFGASAVTFARFVPVVRTFAPVAAGVGGMRRGAFTLFNTLGALGWSISVILIGFGFGHLPGVTGFFSNYLDLILIAIVVVSVGPVLVRGLLTRKRTRAVARAETGAVSTASRKASGPQ